jgi:hypothetical protein
MVFAVAAAAAAVRIFEIRVGDLSLQQMDCWKKGAATTATTVATTPNYLSQRFLQQRRQRWLQRQITYRNGGYNGDNGGYNVKLLIAAAC